MFYMVKKCSSLDMSTLSFLTPDEKKNSNFKTKTKIQENRSDAKKKLYTFHLFV